MPYYEFALQVDAVKHVPIGDTGDGDQLFQARWFLNETTRGMSHPRPRVGDEVALMYGVKFGVDSKGLITHLLQVSIVDVTHGEANPSLAGVLMIDLNAHVPRPPKTSSKQVATLAMARCPCDPPVLIRLSLECVPAKADPTVGSGGPRGAVNSASMRRQPSLSSATQSPIPRAPSAIRSGSEQPSEGLRHDIADGVLVEADRLQNSVSCLTSANDQLRDENVLLRRALDRARNDGDHGTFASGHALELTALQSLSREEEHVREMEQLRTENVNLSKALAAAKESVKRSETMEADLRREVHSLTRAKAFLQAELDRTAKELDNERENARRADSNGEMMSLREMLTSSQQMVKDLRAMLHSSDTLCDSLKRELATVKKDLEDKLKRSQDAVKLAEQRAVDAERNAEMATSAVALGQRELVKMHRYGVDIAAKLKVTAEALATERGSNRQLLRQLEDLKAVASAQSKFATTMAARSSSQTRVAAPVVDLSNAYFIPVRGASSSTSRRGTSPEMSAGYAAAAELNTSL